MTWNRAVFCIRLTKTLLTHMLLHKQHDTGHQNWVSTPLASSFTSNYADKAIELLLQHPEPEPRRAVLSLKGGILLCQSSRGGSASLITTMKKTPPTEARNAHGLPLPHLAALRKQAGLSQRTLAERAGLCMQTISRIEHGANARYDTIELLSEALQVSSARLLRPSRRRAVPAPKALPEGATSTTQE